MVNEGKIHNLSNKTTVQMRSKPYKDIRRKENYKQVPIMNIDSNTLRIH